MLHREFFILMQQILLMDKQVISAAHTLKEQENFGSKLFQHSS
jgi:hypothetical protein